ncbi:MAG TPA: ATP synthase F0 subunit B [Selenomonas sp.]|jgi:F-type H+-transporting ATPase subunit b|nr:ATP synthase F0 subunit B [Selenomonas sp.]
MTLVAQILNFLILVALLRAFCYKPVVRLLKARQDRIAESLNKADADAAEADKLLASYKAKLAEANKKAEAIVSRAQAQAEQEHEAKIQETNAQIAQMKKEAAEQIENDRARAVEKLKGEMVALSLAAAGKIIARNLDKDDNAQLIDEFVNELDKDKIGDVSC